MTHSFFGGVYPATRKDMTRRKPLARLSRTPMEIVIPLIMCADGPATPLVRPGDPVLASQPIARRGQTGAAAHASVSGRVVAIEERPHPWGGRSPAIVIQNDERGERYPGGPPPLDPRQLTLEQLVERVEWAGIVGMGGGAFPTWEKIARSAGKVDTLIVNVAECEPYVTADYRLLLERSEHILRGAQAIARCLQAERVVVVTEGDKLNAVEAVERRLRRSGNGRVQIIPVRTCYPLGAEKQIIQTVTGREVPPGGGPTDAGCAVFNVATVFAIQDALFQGRPVTHRAVTITGGAVTRPRNLWVPIGTPLRHLLETCGGLKEEADLTLTGGPMMGIALQSLEAPVMKDTNSLVCLTGWEHKPDTPGGVCIRCGKCVGACPMHLAPTIIRRALEDRDMEKLSRFHLEDCNACGCCSFICPAQIPLVETVTQAANLVKKGGRAMTSGYTPKRMSPQLRQPSTTRAMMADVMVALVPALGMAVFFFGPRALVLTAVSVGSCVLFEALYRLLTRQRQSVGDLSACVTGLLLALSLPASAPYWVPVMGAAFAIIVVKQFYGGLGRNFMNPALAGRMLAGTLPMLMTTWPQPMQKLSLTAVDAVSAATPMSYLHEGVLPPVELRVMFLGLRGGCMGEVSAFMLLLGMVYLLLRRVISARIPLAYLGTSAVLALLSVPEGISPLTWTACQLMGGGLLMGAIFFATDPTTSPVTPRGHIMFGVGCGLLTALLRSSSPYPEGVGWAILTMNCMVWLLDRLGLPRRFGIGNFAATRAVLAQTRASLAEIKFVRPKLNIQIPRPREGRAPGEAYLDLLRSALKAAGPFAGVFVVTCAVIFGVHRFTDLNTARADIQAQREILAQAMPQASVGAETPYHTAGALSIIAGYDEEGHLLGYCVSVQSQGFGGPVTMTVGVDLNGAVTGVAIESHSETDRVGTTAMTPAALARYVGRSGTIRTSGNNSVDTVSGATATSKAITAGVNRALNIVANLDTSEVIDYEDTQ